MPMAKQKSSAGLAIELDDGRKFYTFGSKVSGNVTLNTAQDFAIGSVSIEFYGRVKVYYVQSHGQGESQWRGRAPLFSETRTLYQGYHTHKPGSFSWPFAFEIPLNPDIAAIKQSKHQWKEKEHFLSTEDYIPGHPMPPTFEFRKWGFGYRWHVFVEYVLKAEVKQAEGARMVLPPSSRKATLPIMVKHVSTEATDNHSLPLAVQFTLPEQFSEKARIDESRPDQPQLQTQVFTPTVRSSRLVTWYKTPAPSSGTRNSFSIREKTRQVFNSSSLPRYTFRILVSVPETVQLLHENAIPFVVSAHPIRDQENTTIQPDEYPDVRIDNMSLSVTALTYFRFKGPFGGRPANYDIKLLDQYPVDHTLKMSPSRAIRGSSSYQDVTDKDDLGDTKYSDSVDLSKLPGLSVEIIAAKMGLQTEKPLAISFNTYIIAREYKLRWKLELDVAGEKVRLQNDDAICIKLLPPDPKRLETLMNDDDVTKVQHHDEEEANEEANEEQSDDSTKAQDPKGKGPMGNFIKRRKGKKTKEEEAAEESASASAASSSRPLQFQHDEMLPRYEQTTNDFGYRHEIDERPPRYD